MNRQPTQRPCSLELHNLARPDQAVIPMEDHMEEAPEISTLPLPPPVEDPIATETRALLQANVLIEEHLDRLIQQADNARADSLRVTILLFVTLLNQLLIIIVVPLLVNSLFPRHLRPLNLLLPGNDQGPEASEAEDWSVLV